MAGSQLKQLKSALKSQGLIGQTNQKKKGKRTQTPSESRRDDKAKIIDGIRTQFNQFDQRFNRTKHDVSVISGGKFVKAGSKQHNDATRAKSTVQKTMRSQYDLEKQQHNKTGGLVDRRFGENNSNLLREEKMLERFTRERQASAKKNVFSLGSDDEEEEDDDDGGFMLTHAGKALDDSMGETGKRYHDEEPEAEPNRKKSKKEVMQEIIAKSKFHKQQRQKAFQAAQDEIMDLDEDFGDVMDEIRNVKPAQNPFNSKSAEEIAYDTKVRELTYDRRAVPADRTKTEEEIRKEREEKMKKLETDRLNRMNGIVEDGEQQADDLDDFWAGSDDEAGGFAVGSEEEQEESDELSDEEEGGRPKTVKTPAVFMPSSQEALEEALSTVSAEKQPAYIKKIVETYKPHLAEGNKDKMNQFVGVLFQHILHIADGVGANQDLVEEFVKITKKLAETYNETIVAVLREEMDRIQERVQSDAGLLKRDLVFFVLVGCIFSTSDHYHLVVTPTLILMNELLSRVQFLGTTSLQQIAQGVFISDILLSYQRLSKRYVPEMINFVEKSLLLLVPEPASLAYPGLLSASMLPEELREATSSTGLNLSKSAKFKPAQGTIALDDLVLVPESDAFKFRLLTKIFEVIDKFLTTYRDKAILLEIVEPLVAILKHSVRYFGSEFSSVASPLLSKLSALAANFSRKPLALQLHRQVAIKTFAPKFEENFNPDKKSYDDNRDRQEMNKLKAQLKKEKKSALRDVRQELRFVATRRIEEKKKMYEDYHRKMANIVNTISTVEGAEKNQYEKEKKMRKNK